MEHREIKTPEQIAELKQRSPGGYRNLREVVINELPDVVLFRSPKASEGSGGALGEAEALKRGNTVGVRDQVIDLVSDQGLKVSRKSANPGGGEPLMPTPTVFHVSMHDEPIEKFLEREQKSSTGQIGKSLGVAIRMEVINDDIVSDTDNKGS